MLKAKIGSLKDLSKNNQFSRWINDHDILAEARKCVSDILSTDPKLKLPINSSIRDYISHSGKSKNLWRYIS